MARRNKPKEEFLWVEKYRPTSLTECILPDRIIDILQSQVENGEMINMMFRGGPGVGKTAAGVAMANDLDMDVLIINASKDGNIDTLRTTIQNFAMNKSFTGKKKLVILDEADYLNAQSTQPALRNFIEEYSHNCRFIFTCNYPKKIIEALASRLTEIDFTLTKKEQGKMAPKFLARFCDILQHEKVAYEKKTVAQLILKYTPDYRKILNELQGVTSKGELLPSDVSLFSAAQTKELAGWISTRKFSKCREWVAENSSLGFSTFMKVRDDLEKLITKESIPEMFTIFSDHDRTSSFATDMEVHMTACIVALMFELEYLE